MRIPWDSGSWLHPPQSVDVIDDKLVIRTTDQSDFWNRTGHELTTYSGHALLREFPPDNAMEVEFSAEWTHEFDQAGLFLHADKEHWVKTGIEYADGVLGLGAVVTNGQSDWSAGNVHEWMEAKIRVRISRTKEVITIRARSGDEPWRFVRLAPIDPGLEWSAGPFAASPTRSDLKVTFHAWEAHSCDTKLH